MRRYGLVDIPTEAADIDAVPISRTITINSVTYDLSENRSWIVTGGTSSGGSSVNYYLNGSVAASVATYKQMSFTPVIGLGTNFTLTSNGLIAQFLTDIGNPNRVLIPGGSWNFEMYFSSSSNGGNEKFYVELYKYDGTAFTFIASNSTAPEAITGGTSTDLYLTSLAVPETILTTTDRLAVRVYIVDNSTGRTITLHTEDNNLCEIITSFAGGVTSLNALTANTQYLVTGTAGTDFNIVSLVDTHTFNIPTASATKRGALSSADWTTFNSKQNTITLTTTGFGGASTFTSNVLNIPIYQTFLANPITGTGLANINEIAYWIAPDQIDSLSTATYPSLSELSYVKGVTSSIQTQLDARLPLAGGTMTGQIVLSLASSPTDYTQGIKFPDNPYGGSGDIAGMRLYEGDFGSAEDMCLELYIKNDDGAVGFDKINFSAPTNDSVTINGYPILHSGNFAAPIQNGIISGGIVTWTGTGLIFDISECLYYINGESYTSPFTTKTLEPADATNPRIDVFAVNTSGLVQVIQGVPNVNPVEPEGDTDTTLGLTNVTINAGATTPSGVTRIVIYDENLAAPAEWTKNNYVTGTIDYNNTSFAYTGTKSIRVVMNNGYANLSFNNGVTVLDISSYKSFSFAIRLNAAWTSNQVLNIRFYNNIGLVVASFQLNNNNNGVLGFNRNLASVWQFVTVPLDGTILKFTENKFLIVQLSVVGNATTYNLDTITLNGGIDNPNGNNSSTNSFGFVNATTGTATSDQATDTLNVVGSGLVTTTATGKTLTISVPSAGTTNYITKYTPNGTSLGDSQIFDNGTSVGIGTITPSAANLLQVEGIIASNSNKSYPAGGTVSGLIGSTQASTNYTFGGNLTIPNSINTSSILALSNLTFTSTGTVTQDQAAQLRSVSNIVSQWSFSGTVNGTITHLANTKLNSPYTASSATLSITNYYGLIIEDSSQYAGFSITNKFGIYQYGAGDKNYFQGDFELTKLAGTGTRMVVADANGLLSTQAIPGGGGGSMAIGGSITGATAGSVLFAGTSGVLAQDNTNFFWDNATDRLGIGTNAPTTKLHIIGTGVVTTKIKSTTSGGASAYQAENDTASIFEFGMWGSARAAFGTILSGNAYMYGGSDFAITSATNIKFGTGASVAERMRITTAGRLLLGTISEGTFLLDVNGSARVIGSISFLSDASSNIGKTTSATYKYLNGYNFFNTTSGDINFLNDFATGKINFGAGQTTNPQMTLNANGTLALSNVGINRSGTSGTTSIAIGTGTGATASGSSSIAIGNQVSASGINSIAIGERANAPLTSAISIGYFVYGAANTFVSGSYHANITNVYFGNGIISDQFTASPGISYTINGSGGFGTNQIGGNITIAGGKGTGTGTSGDIIFSTATTTTTGTTLQTLTNRWWIKGTTGILSNTASPSVSAILQVDSTTRGFLPPRMSTPQRDAIASPVGGLIIFNINTSALNYYDGTGWVSL